MIMTTRRTRKEIIATAGPIASFVRDCRKKLGYTQAEFAPRLGVGLRFLKELELGKKSLRMDKVESVLNFLGHTLAPQPMKRQHWLDDEEQDHDPHS